MNRRIHFRRGITRFEAAAASGCVGAVIAMAAVVQDPVRIGDTPGDKSMVQTVKDATQLSQIHKGMVVFARQLNGRLPTPGLIDRLPHPEIGDVPGIGEEDVSLNTTANLYACMVAHDYMSTEILISPVERNPKVTVDKDFNYEAYAPIDDEYWDKTFAADLEAGSNVSYAHMPIVGEWGKMHWRDNMDSAIVVLGNRGPMNGQRDFRSHTCDPHGYWSGNIVFADNHVEFWRNPASEKFTDPDDNIFEAGKNIISFTADIKDGNTVLQWD